MGVNSHREDMEMGKKAYILSTRRWDTTNQLLVSIWRILEDIPRYQMDIIHFRQLLVFKVFFSINELLYK